jgi:hypothetical protein
MQHPILIKSAMPELSFDIGPNLQLATAFCCRWIDRCPNQPLHVLAPLVCVDDMSSLVTTFESALSKWKHHPLFFLFAIEECTCLTGLCEL